mgnify:CR=1 FL=1
MPGQLNTGCTTSYPLTPGINNIVIPLPSINVSVQVGDKMFVIYAMHFQSTNNIDHSFNDPVEIGDVVDITSTSITIAFNNCASCPCAPELDDYLMFAKDKKVNVSGLKGYYLQAEFQNNSKKHAELYSVGTEVTESSK